MQKCPVTILTGFLGSGKTTLLNRILTDPTHGKRIAVLENELSLEIGVEKELVVNSDQMEENFIQVIEFGNGCVCCSSRGDFERILHELAEKRITSHKDGVEAPFDYIIIETTGLADPIFIQSFFQDEHINENFYLDGIVTLIDAKHAWHHLQDISSSKKKNEAIQQIVFADRIVINKIDLAESPQDLQKLEETLKQINSVAPITKTTFSNLNISTILDIKSFDIEKLDPDSKSRVLSTTTSMANTHNANLTTVVILGKGDVDEQLFKDWLYEKTKSSGNQIFRIKGILALKNKEKQYTLQGVHELFSIQEHPSGKVWTPEDEKLTKVVFIGTGLNKEEFNSSFKAKLGIDSFWM